MQAIDIDGKYHEVSPDEIQWRPSVYAIVIKDSKILLSPQHGKGYNLPGGGVNLGESLEVAVVRETKEETGLDVRVIRTLTVYDNLFKVTRPGAQGVYHAIMVHYLCEMTGGNLSNAGFGEYEKDYAQLAEWVLLEKLDTISPAASYDWREIVRAAIS